MAMENVWEGWGENWQKARGFLTEATKQGVAAIAETAARSQERLLATASQAMDQVNDAASQAVIRVTEAAEMAKISFNETVLQSEQFSEAVTKAVRDAIAAASQNWLAAHPTIAWFFTHPFWTVGLLFLSLLLLWGLLASMARLTEQAWLAVFQFPCRLGRSLLVKVFSQTRRQYSKSKPDSNQERLHYILNRLEEIKGEQAQLLAEMKEIILKTQSSCSSKGSSNWADGGPKDV